MTTIPFDNAALQVYPDDNVAVAKQLIATDTSLAMPRGDALTVRGEVPVGHRFALVAIPSGALVKQYGQPIGTSRGLDRGDVVTTETMSNDIPIVRELPDDLSNPAPQYTPEAERPTFQGYRRPDGRVGTRNWVLIVPTSMCSSHEAVEIARRAETSHWDRTRYPNVDGVVATPHNKGCGCPDGLNVDVVLRTLANTADHPNVGAVIFVDLGCEKTNCSLMRDYLQKHGGFAWKKPMTWISIQQEGGAEAAIAAGLRDVQEMLPAANRVKRQTVPASDLVLGLECGGSDGLSGLSANPALGHATDLLIRAGGTAVLTEVPELCGAEHILAHRAVNAEVGRAVYRLVDWYKEFAGRSGVELGENRSPGNIAAGLLNITIKSLGAAVKAGTTRVEGVTDYAVPVAGRGLQVMQGPGYDQESLPGVVAAGATVVVFTTGLGTPIGNAIVPVVKLASNTALARRMPHDIDLSAGGIIDGSETIQDVGQRLFYHVLQVAAGTVAAKAEQNRHRDFQIWTVHGVSL